MRIITKKVVIVLIATLFSFSTFANAAAAQTKKAVQKQYDDLLSSVAQYIRSNVEKGFCGVATKK